MEQPNNLPPAVYVMPPQYLIARRDTSALAVTSMILGIISLMGGAVFLLPPLLAVIFGHISVGSCARNPNLDGKGLGIAGLVMGWFCLAGWIIFIVFCGGIALLAGAAAAASH